jgi:hypothetical protein
MIISFFVIPFSSCRAIDWHSIESPIGWHLTVPFMSLPSALSSAIWRARAFPRHPLLPETAKPLPPPSSQINAAFFLPNIPRVWIRQFSRDWDFDFDIAFTVFNSNSNGSSKTSDSPFHSHLEPIQSHFMSQELDNVCWYGCTICSKHLEIETRRSLILGEPNQTALSFHTCKMLTNDVES